MAAVTLQTDTAASADAASVSKRAVVCLGWSLFAIACAGSAAGWLLLAASGSQADRAHGGGGLQYLDFPVFALVGALIVSRRHASVIGWLFCGAGVLSSLSLNGLGYGYVHYALAGPGREVAAGVWVAWLTDWVNDVSFALGPLIMLLFPTGRPASPRWRPVVWCAIAAAVLSPIADALRPGPRENFPFVQNPVGVPIPALVPISQGFGVLEAMLFLVGAASVFARLRSARGVERQQVKWFGYATCLIALGVVVVIVGPQLLRLNSTNVPEWLIAALNEFWSVAILAVPVSIGIAILRHRLFDIDAVINRTLVYGLLTASIVAIYALVVGYCAILFQARGDIASLLAAGVAAVLFQPIRQRVQTGVNRLLYGRRDEPYAVISQLGQRLESSLAPSGVLPAIVETIRHALKLPYVALEVRSESGAHVAAEAGVRQPTHVRVDLPYQREIVGSLLIASRAPGEPLSSSDRQLLLDLARQAGVAVRAVRLSDELQRARERLVVAREEERRRLRRDLHDGLGPQLASQSLGLEAARKLLRSDPAAADTLLSTLAEYTQAAVADIRRLVYELRPPALDDLGLVGALRQQARAYAQGGGLVVEVQAPEVRMPLSAAAEVAAYRIAQEAVTNVIRHAQAHTCVLGLDLDPAGKWLTLEISDDGRGMDPEARPGVGLTSMRERATELGGDLCLQRGAGGGTRVIARLPLAQAAGGWSASAS